MCRWFSSFLLNPLVRRVKRRIPMRIERFCRSTCDVLTSSIGHPLLAQHVHMVTMFMKAAGSWDEFVSNLNKVAPRQGDNYELPLEF